MSAAAEPTPAPELRERLGLGDRTVALTLSAHRPHKNLMRLLDALATLPAERAPGARRAGLPDGATRSSFESHAAQLGIAGRRPPARIGSPTPTSRASMRSRACSCSPRSTRASASPFWRQCAAACRSRARTPPPCPRSQATPPCCSTPATPGRSRPRSGDFFRPGAGRPARGPRQRAVRPLQLERRRGGHDRGLRSGDEPAGVEREQAFLPASLSRRCPTRTPPRTSLRPAPRAASATRRSLRRSCRSATSTSPAPLPSRAESSRSQRAIPLELVRCDMTRDQNACGLIQTRHTVPGAILYHSYWYRSGVNRTMTENLHEIAPGSRAAGRPASPATWSSTSAATTALCSTATRPSSLRYLGFDPSDVTRYAVEKGYDVVRDFYSYAGLRRALSGPQGEGRSPRSRCSTTSRIPAPSSPTSPQPWPRTASG